MRGSVDGWPFLVARGRRRGYKTVLAPDFLVERHLHGLLSEAASGCDLAPEASRTMELQHGAVGPLTLVFRLHQLTPEDLEDGSGTDEVDSTDEHGRPLEILYGVVTRKRLSGAMDDDDWRVARGEALRSYRGFLAHEEGFRADASRAFGLRGPTLAPPAPRAGRAAPKARPKARPAVAPKARAAAPRHRLALPLSTVAVGAGLAAAVTSFPASDPQPQLQALPAPNVRIAGAHPSAGVQACLARGVVILRAAITTTGPATVTYRWGGIRPAPAPTTLQLSGPGTHVVMDTVPRIGQDLRAGVSDVTLVIDRPDRLRRTVPIEAACLAAPTPTPEPTATPGVPTPAPTAATPQPAPAAIVPRP